MLSDSRTIGIGNSGVIISALNKAGLSTRTETNLFIMFLCMFRERPVNTKPLLTILYPVLVGLSRAGTAADVFANHRTESAGSRLACP